MKTLPMRTPTASDLNTAAGIRHVSEWLHARALSGEAQGRPARVTIGPFTITDDVGPLTAAAVSVKRGAHSPGYWRTRLSVEGIPTHPVTTSTGVYRLDAVRHYGTPEAGLAAIRRQLAAQSSDMDPADVKRCERAAVEIERHLMALAERARREAEADATARTFQTAVQADPGNPPYVGVEVFTTHRHRDYMGKVLGNAMRKDDILRTPLRHVHVQLTHRRETVDGVYDFTYSRKLAAVWIPCRDVRVPLNPAPVVP